MYDPLTAVIDRVDRKKERRPEKIKRILIAILACLAVVALTVSATFAVHFYLELKEQERRTASTSEQISSLQQSLDAQSEQLASQQAQLSAQESEIAAQKEQIKAQQSTIEEQKDTIEKQQETIKQQSTTTSTTKKTTTASTTKKTVKGAITYPEIDVSALKGKKLVALTFDDGPGPYTEKLLNALKKHNAKATFFVVGSRLGSDTNKNLLKRMEQEGHVVGNHSQNHKNLTYLSASNIESELYTTSARIKKIIGHYPYVLRFPGGNYNSTVLSYAKSIKTPVIQWNLDTVDWRDRNKTTVVNRVKNNVKDGSIVLMHDLYSTSVDAACELIPYLQKKGYTLVTVPELIAAKQGKAQPGKVYFNG